MIKENKQISIIIPIYNASKYLDNCINSVLAQTFSNWEIILVNDGSQDNSEEIALEFSSNCDNIHYYFQKNEGVSAARNLGIEKSNGEWLIFLDSDDYWSSEYLQSIFNQYNGKSDIIITGITKIFKNGSKKEILPPFDGVISIDKVFENFVLNQLNTGIFGFVSNKIIKKDLVLKNKINFDVNIKLCEDLDFFVKIYPLCDNFFFTSECGNFYRYFYKNNEVDYIALIQIFDKMKKMLTQNMQLNNKNEIALLNNFSELKYAYFNELRKINDLNIEKGIHFLEKIKLKDNDDYNKKIIKYFSENRKVKMLKFYLEIRSLYMNFRKNGFKKSNFLCAWW